MAFSVSGSASTGAVNDNVGTGPVDGAVGFLSGYVPTINASGCVADSWSFSGGSTEAVMFNVNESQYVGPLAISAAGNSCATTGLEAGPITSLSASGGYSPLNIGFWSTSCNLVPGTTNEYFRIGTHVLVLVNTNCYVNAWPAPNTAFISTGEFRPTNGDGVDFNITQAAYDGVFSALPS
jgi:hypothetical protein